MQRLHIMTAYYRLSRHRRKRGVLFNELYRVQNKQNGGGMNIITVTQYLKIKMGVRRAFSDTKLKSIDQELKVSLLTNSNGKVKGSGGLRRNHMYKGIDFKDITPCKKWEDYFETESEIPWKNAFETLYLSTRINKLREFQYKLIHRVATCRYMRKQEYAPVWGRA